MFWKTLAVTLCLLQLTQADSCNDFKIESTVGPIKSMNRSSCINGKNFVLVTLGRTTWFQAGNICRYNGMQLATINSVDEQMILTNLKEQSSYSNSGFWTSGNDLSCQKKWYWSSNGKPIEYFNWGSGEPNNAKKNERCIKINAKKSVWNDDSCESLNHYICEEECICK